MAQTKGLVGTLTTISVVCCFVERGTSTGLLILPGLLGHQSTAACDPELLGKIKVIKKRIEIKANQSVCVALGGPNIHIPVRGIISKGGLTTQHGLFIIKTV